MLNEESRLELSKQDQVRQNSVPRICEYSIYTQICGAEYSIEYLVNRLLLGYFVENSVYDCCMT